MIQVNIFHARKRDGPLDWLAAHNNVPAQGHPNHIRQSRCRCILPIPIPMPIHFLINTAPSHPLGPNKQTPIAKPHRRHRNDYGVHTAIALRT